MTGARDTVVLITGATDGIGRATARALAAHGATVLVHGRDARRVAETVAEAETAGAAAARGYVADFESLAAVRTMSARILAEEPRLDVLINNAGVGILDTRHETVDGCERVFQVNFLAGHALTRGLIERLAERPGGRVVDVASAGQWPLDLDDPQSARDWHGAFAYGRSKLAQVAACLALAEREPRVAFNALHPGSLLPTKLRPPMLAPVDTLDTAVDAILHAAIDPSMAGVTGRYYDKREPIEPHAQALDSAFRERLLRIAGGLIAAG
ncbi:MAG: SDR family NAD(P)-dependent oxidoreductase [Lysobacter sp.]|nr:MAG: SDR family NAD(P)-dependent oxidoreductase [Lysobacter sp.]